MRKDTVICIAFLVGAFILICGLIMFRTSTPALSQAVPARPSGQAIALTCARVANVDMTPGVPITLAQVQEMERCAVRMMAILR